MASKDSDSEKITKWDDVPKIILKYTNKNGKKWIFRGQDQCKIKSHLEKEYANYFEDGDIRDIEKKLIREFQRKASLYINRVPDKNEIVEWIALMRHYGTPTRFVDFTYSFYVALYFAIAGLDMSKRRGNARIYAIDSNGLGSPEYICTKYKNTIEDYKDKVNEYSYDDILKLREEKYIDDFILCDFIDNPKSLVYTMNPFELNKRLTIQQGLFLCPGNISISFERNLNQTLRDQNKEKRVIFINLQSKTERNNILSHLRHMNITNVSLFGTLESFSRTINESMAYPEIYDFYAQ